MSEDADSAPYPDTSEEEKGSRKRRKSSTGEHVEHPGVGAFTGFVAGAAIGFSVGGPVGAVVGAFIGQVVGAGVGSKV